MASEPDRGSVDDAASVKGTLRWTRPLAVVAAGALVFVTIRAHPGPGVHGQALGVTVAVVVFAAGVIGFERVAATPGAPRVVLLFVEIGAAAALVAIQPNGPGFLGMIPPVSASSFRLRDRPAAGIALLSLAGIAIGAAAGRHRPVEATVIEILAIAAYYGLARFAGRFIKADEYSQFMITQLEQTRAAQAEAAALGERQRLAREMHDVLAHSLSGLVLNLEGARLMSERGVTGPSIHEAITRAHQLAKTGLEEAQRAIGMLRDDALPGPARLDQLAADFEADTDVRCVFMLTGDERELAPDCRLTVYRVAQEALTNVRKHACADRVDVRLAYEAAGTRLTVEDVEPPDRPPPPGGGTGYGLTGMRERAELLGGTLTAEPTDHGFRVELWVPG